MSVIARTEKRWPLTVLALVIVVAIIGGVLFIYRSTSSDAEQPPGIGVGKGELTTPVPRRPEGLFTQPENHWDMGSQSRLATAPMTYLPVEATAPQPMTVNHTGPALALPQGLSSDGVVLNGAEASANAALAQVKTMNEAGLRGGDPARYAQVYHHLSAPGAPPAEQSGLYGMLQQLRSSAGLPPVGSVPGLHVEYYVTQGQIKGVTDDGRYVVACVLGQLAVDYQGKTVTRGLADCQAVRHVGDHWRISPGPLAAPAPQAWPGSADAVRAGYRDIYTGR